MLQVKSDGGSTMTNQPGLMTKTLTILLAVGLAAAFIYYRNGELQSKVSSEEFVQPQNPNAGTHSPATPGQSEQVAINDPMLMGGSKSMAVMTDLDMLYHNTTDSAYLVRAPDSRMTTTESFYMMSSKSGAVFPPPQDKVQP